MKHIKLDAIDSTNEFLKGLSSIKVVDNFTVVTAENQTKGKGQMGSSWTSEPTKNLIMSVLVNDFLFDKNRIFEINIVTAITIIEALQTFDIPKLSIKWPNDILSDNKKIGGVLIENCFKNDCKIISIIGLGLNVNQIDFEQLPKASSLAVICNTTFDKESILFKIVEKLKYNCLIWKDNKEIFLLKYNNLLFKKGIPMPFVQQSQQKFMGIIQGVTTSGKLKIILENDSIVEFEIKEIQMLY
ncbi:biotin--[acetyl-CoA-carboxylase] ligase [Flavobacterium sp.]|uniref:biotin--[acetyl-CoA-carboxylase] ligase n=1 Tax=Flavobacterium sp. TaxID=239 RepID=UPI0038FC2E95